MEIKSIKTEEDYQAALQRLEEIFDAELGTLEGDELEALFDSPRPKPTLVGPPATSPAASLITPAEEKKPRSKRTDTDDRDRPPLGGAMVPQPAG